MGKHFSKCVKRSSSKRKITVLMLGLDNAGKTTTAKHFLGEATDDVVPTVGFSTMKFQHKKYEVEVYDLGGSSRIRGIWKKYYALVHGVVFVVDSTDKDRLEECKVILTEVVQDPRVSKKPILLLVNKQDKEGALNEVELCGLLELESLVNQFECPTRVETSVAAIKIKKRKDKGIDLGFQWLLNHVIKNFAILDKRVEGESHEQREEEEKERLERMERVRKSREDREKVQSDQTVPKSPPDVAEALNGNPFRPISEVSMNSTVRDSSERKLSVGGPRTTETVATVHSENDFSDTTSNENIIDKEEPKKKKKHFKNKVSPCATDISNTPAKTIELPPIRAAVNPHNGWAKPALEIANGDALMPTSTKNQPQTVETNNP